MASTPGVSEPALQRSRPTFEQFTAIRRYQPALAFSPDGAELAYSVNTSGQYNLWRQSSDGGYPHQVTLSGEHAVREIHWSPDGETLLYTADRNGDEFTQVYLVSPHGGRPDQIPSEPDVQNALSWGQSWSPDGRYIAYAGNDREPTDQDVIVRDVQTGESRRPLAGDGLFFATGWSPDGGYLLGTKVVSNSNSDVYLIDLADDSTRLLTEHEGEANHYPVGWASDGSGFYLLTDVGREFTGLGYYDITEGRWDWVETPDWDVEDATVSADGRWLVWSVNEDGYSRLYVRDLNAQGEPIQIDLPPGVLGTMVIAPSGDRLGVQWLQAMHPTEIFVVGLNTATVIQITHSFLGGVGEADLTQPELIRYPTFDGREVPAFLYRPAGATGRIPVVLSIHGGPEAQERPQYMYSGLYQYLNSRGIAVLAPNIRGSTGYGKSYQRLIQHDWGGDELKDLDAAARYLQGCDWVDRDRIGLFGGSFGGFATLSCASRLPDYWAAAVDLVGPSNLVTFAKAVPPTWRRMMAQWVGDPETEVDFLMSRSPITYVDKITTPLFVIQGANDPRVVKPESDQIVERLRERGVTVRYDVYDDEGHGFTKRENELKAFRDITAFLEEHLLAKW
jgi:dipeptidyl aminopeptidase/acylaminoacyl peptidase